MALQSTVRRRAIASPSEVKPDSTPQTGRDGETQPVSLPASSLVRRPRFNWRFVVRWVARVLLIVCLLLYNVRVVEVGQPHESGDSGSAQGQPDGETVVLVITHSRADYLSRCLDSLLQYHPRNSRWPIIVSQDQQDSTSHEDVADVVARSIDIARESGISMITWAHNVTYARDFEAVETPFVDLDAYRRISKHYHWALSRVFSVRSNARVVIIEDDMEIAPDFYSYFDALTPLLERDRTLFCISAWNDNGKPGLAIDPRQLHRTDFFPGLGWMMTRSLWNEVAHQWPKLFWDDWMRSLNRTKGRQCIRPEVSRAANFGATGASSSFQYEQHVSKVKLGEANVNFSSVDLSYLDPNKYEHMIFERMSNAVLLRFSNYLSTRPQDADVIAMYPDGNPQLIGKRTGIMTDHRNGIFRTSYRGVIVIPWNGHWAFIVPRGFVPPDGYRLGVSVCCD